MFTGCSISLFFDYHVSPLDWASSKSSNVFIRCGEVDESGLRELAAGSHTQKNFTKITVASSGDVVTRVPVWLLFICVDTAFLTHLYMYSSSATQRSVDLHVTLSKRNERRHSEQRTKQIPKKNMKKNQNILSIQLRKS